MNFEIPVGLVGEFTCQVIRRGKIVSEGKKRNAIAPKWMRAGLTLFMKKWDFNTDYTLSNNTTLTIGQDHSNRFYEHGMVTATDSNNVVTAVNNIAIAALDTVNQPMSGSQMDLAMVQGQNCKMRVDYYRSSTASQPGVMLTDPSASVVNTTSAINNTTILADDPPSAPADGIGPIGMTIRNSAYHNIQNLWQNPGGVNTTLANNLSIVSLWSDGNATGATVPGASVQGDPGVNVNITGTSNPLSRGNTVGNGYFGSGLRLPDDDESLGSSGQENRHLIAYTTDLPTGGIVVTGDQLLITYKLVPQYASFNVASPFTTLPISNVTTNVAEDGGLLYDTAIHLIRQMWNGGKIVNDQITAGGSSRYQWARMGIFINAGNSANWNYNALTPITGNTNIIEFGAYDTIVRTDFNAASTGFPLGDFEHRIGHWSQADYYTSIAMSKSVQQLSNDPRGAWIGHAGSLSLEPAVAPATQPTLGIDRALGTPGGELAFCVKYPTSHTPNVSLLGYNTGNLGKRHTLTFILKLVNQELPGGAVLP